MSKQKTAIKLQTAYVEVLMAVVGRSLVGISKYDEEVQKELSAFEPGYIIEMRVLPTSPNFRVKVNPDGTLSLDKSSEPAGLLVNFKHVTHAYTVFTFQEGTAKAFANDRMVVDGDLSDAIRLVRCLNKLESIILPKFIAQLAVKRYPNISFSDKVSLALKVYSSVAKQLVTGS